MTAPQAVVYTQFAAEKRRAALLALLALLMIRWLSLVAGETDLFFDEAQYWTWSQDLAFGYFSKPPLIAWIIRTTTWLCGDGEACVRASAPLFYFGTSVMLYFVARELYDEPIALASALVFATLPGVSFSSTQISTDVPLLFFFSLALLAWVKFLKSRHLGWAVALGAAVGLGLLSKYAMTYFVLGIAVHLVVSPAARKALRASGLVVAAILALLIASPHLVWNYRYGFVTFTHTAENASWGWDLFHPLRFLEFFGAQFGVFGPILFAALLVIAWRSLRDSASEARPLLLSFSMPILLLICVQAFISRAHANWAATAYPAATILVTATLLQGGWTRLFRCSLGLHVIVALAMAAALPFAARLWLPFDIDAFSRQLGWPTAADIVRNELARRPYTAVLTADRQVTAELLYYLRDTDVPITAWLWSDVPNDHFQLTKPFHGSDGPVLLVTLEPPPDIIEDRFAVSETLSETPTAAGPMRTRTVWLTHLAGYQDPAP